MVPPTHFGDCVFLTSKYSVRHLNLWGCRIWDFTLCEVFFAFCEVFFAFCEVFFAFCEVFFALCEVHSSREWNSVLNRESAFARYLVSWTIYAHLLPIANSGASFSTTKIGHHSTVDKWVRCLRRSTTSFKLGICCYRSFQYFTFWENGIRKMWSCNLLLRIMWSLLRILRSLLRKKRIPSRKWNKRGNSYQ